MSFEGKVGVYVYIHIYIDIHIYIYIWVYIYICICRVAASHIPLLTWGMFLILDSLLEPQLAIAGFA